MLFFKNFKKTIGIEKRSGMYGASFIVKFCLIGLSLLSFFEIKSSYGVAYEVPMLRDGWVNEQPYRAIRQYRPVENQRRVVSLRIYIMPQNDTPFPDSITIIMTSTFATLYA